MKMSNMVGWCDFGAFKIDSWHDLHVYLMIKAQVNFDEGVTFLGFASNHFLDPLFEGQDIN